MIVAKFGGTSVSTATRINTICQIVKNQQEKDPIIVVSALAGITNLILTLPKTTPHQRRRGLQEILKIHKLLIEDIFTENEVREELLLYVDNNIKSLTAILKTGRDDKETLDSIVSYGEIISSKIISVALEKSGIPAQQVIATELIVTNNNYGSAEFLAALTRNKTQKKLTALVGKGVVPVITGFIGRSKEGKIATLGRGGSDYSASIIGFCVNAQEIQIWTDVDGMYSADPRYVKNAKQIPEISFKEASELAIFGARVLHPRTIKPAIKAGIPVRILNTFNPSGKGTLIVEKSKKNKSIFSVCAKRNITLVNIYSAEMLLARGFLARVFKTFAKHHISIDLVSVSEVSISVTLDNDDHLSDTIDELSQFSTITTTKNLGTVSIIGDGIMESTKITKDIFDVLHKNNIRVNMVSLGATNINISIVISNEKIQEAVILLHDKIVKGTKK